MDKIDKYIGKNVLLKVNYAHDQHFDYPPDKYKPVSNLPTLDKGRLLKFSDNRNAVYIDFESGPQCWIACNDFEIIDTIDDN